MAWVRGLLTVALVVTAVLLEITVLPWLHLPGAVPDVVAVTVAALGYAAGPVRGATAGFLAGLLLDLVLPEGTHTTRRGFARWRRLCTFWMK